ncbi:MAG TPA: flagellar hook-basal body complex protein FliE [Azoarcus sp.]|nr:flagellar hook-basal body complex protein FliE [Azoarcus sp.]
MDARGIEQLIGELRATAQTAGPRAAQPVGGETQGADFAQVLEATLQDVSAAQQQARTMAQDFVAGKSEAELQEVMVNLQKASLSFQQMVQVRNRLVSAYQDIMNMQV